MQELHLRVPAGVLFNTKLHLLKYILAESDTHIVFFKLPVVLLGEDLLHHRHGLATLPDVLLLLKEGVRGERRKAGNGQAS